MRTLSFNNDFMRGGARATLDTKSPRRTGVNGVENGAFHREREDVDALEVADDESADAQASASVIRMQELR